MSTAASGLKELHALHLKLQEVQEKLDRGPVQIKARHQFAERKRAELEAQRHQLVSLKKAADEKGLQLKTNENKISELKLKLNAAQSNREFDVIKGQIDADTMANSVLEDEILEALDKVDRGQTAVAKLQQEVAKAEAEEERVRWEVAEAEPGLKHEADQLRVAIQDAEKVLPGDVKTDYDRLVQAHGAGALAAVENDTCTACYFNLSPQLRVEVNSGKIVFCRNCGRLLYRAEEK